MNTGIGEAIRRTVPAWRREHFNRLVFPAVCFLLWTTAIPSRAEEGIDQLYSAIHADDLEALTGLRDKGVSSDSSDNRQITALMYAAAIGSIDAMKELLAVGAQVNAQNAFGSTALMWSVTDARKVRLLLDHGADVNIVAKSGYTALISAALTRPSAEVVRMLMQRGADVKATGQNGMTTLNAAAHGNDTGTIETLIKAGVDVNAARFSNRQSGRRQTPAGKRRQHKPNDVSRQVASREERCCGYRWRDSSHNGFRIWST